MTDSVRASEERLIPFYSKTPIAIVKGKGHRVWDEQGKEYLDLTAGIAVVNLGHADPGINRAVSKQLSRISHISNLFIIPGQAELSERISSLAFPGKCFFCNSGAEANEAALKMSRIVGNLQKPGKNKVLALRDSFHGRTIATITLTGQEKYKKGFDPLLTNIDFVAPGSVEELRAKMDDSVCAVFLEAVQGEGGVKLLPAEFVAEARALTTKFNALLVFDEVQTGIGRTGKAFGYQNFKVQPDIITIAKALGNGFPIGAVLVTEAVSSKMGPGMHASTFGGNYLACAAGNAVLSRLTPKTLEAVNRSGQEFRVRLEALRAKYPEMISEVRAYGLMIGVDFSAAVSVKQVLDSLLERRILALRAGDNTLRLVPPFTVGAKEAEKLTQALSDILQSIDQAGGKK